VSLESCWDNIVFVRGDDGSLVIQDSPALLRFFPDGCSAGEAAGLVEGVGEQEGSLTEAAQSECRRFPSGGIGIDQFVLDSHTENEVSAVSTARGAYFPKIKRSGALEIFEASSEPLGVEDGFAAAKLFEDRLQVGVDMCEGGIVGHAGILRLPMLDAYCPRAKQEAGPSPRLPPIRFANAGPQAAPFRMTRQVCTPTCMADAWRARLVGFSSRRDGLGPTEL
jgi:hypothetical protein